MRAPENPEFSRCTARGTGPLAPCHSEIGPAEFSYFFDCGIIVRGLLAVWRATGEQEFLDVAVGTGDSMAKDFASEDGSFHPILTLPGKVEKLGT